MFSTAPRNVNVNSTALPGGGLLGMSDTPTGGLLGALRTPEAALLGSALLSSGHWVGTPVNLGDAIGSALTSASALREQRFSDERNIIQQNLQNKLLDAQLRQMGLQQQMMGGFAGTLAGGNSSNVQPSDTQNNATGSQSNIDNSYNASPSIHSTNVGDANSNSASNSSLPISNANQSKVDQKISSDQSMSSSPLTLSPAQQEIVSNRFSPSNVDLSGKTSPENDLLKNASQLAKQSPDVAPAINRAVAAGFFKMPQIGAQIIDLAKNGTYEQRANLTSSMKELDDARNEYLSAASMKPNLDHFQNTLANTDDKWFLPIVRSEIAPVVNTNFQIMQNTARRLALQANQLFKVPARGFSINEMQGQLQNMGSPNTQNKDSVQDSLNQVSKMINNSKQNYENLLNYFLKNKTTKGYEPVQFGDSNTIHIPGSPSETNTNQKRLIYNPSTGKIE